jgi:hypothetical protein
VTAEQADELIGWAKLLFTLQLAFGTVLLVVLVAIAIVVFWRGG